MFAGCFIDQFFLFHFLNVGSLSIILFHFFIYQ